MDTTWTSGIGLPRYIWKRRGERTEDSRLQLQLEEDGRAKKVKVGNLQKRCLQWVTLKTTNFCLQKLSHPKSADWSQMSARSKNHYKCQRNTCMLATWICGRVATVFMYSVFRAAHRWHWKSMRRITNYLRFASKRLLRGHIINMLTGNQVCKFGEEQIKILILYVSALSNAKTHCWIGYRR